jgi:hypothetical protein
VIDPAKQRFKYEIQKNELELLGRFDDINTRYQLTKELEKEYYFEQFQWKEHYTKDVGAGDPSSTTSRERTARTRN